MPAPLKLEGLRFGRLTVLHREDQDAFKAWRWRCECDCGRASIVRGATLRAGRTSSCASCATSQANTTHGMTCSALYQRWRAMIGRCELRSSLEWHNYGGRGIRVCQRWRESFEAFCADMGADFHLDLEIDRIDVNGNYDPENCRWATVREQQRNKRTNHLVTWQGRTMTVQDWAEETRIKPNTIVHRLRRGWDVDRALSTPGRTEFLEIANA